MSMKKFFRGFTLAELLLCVGIIGIVSAMGITVAKISAEKAYNLLYYTGYINLYNAIADAEYHGKNTNEDIMNHVKDLLSKDNIISSNINNDIKFMTYKADTFTREKTDGVINIMKPGDMCGDLSFGNGNCNSKENLDIPVIGGSGSSSVSGSQQKPNTKPICKDGFILVGNSCTLNLQFSDFEGNFGGSGGSGGSGSDNSVTIEAVNGIKYYYSNDNNIPSIDGVKRIIPIKMTIPQRQTKSNDGISTVRLLYIVMDHAYLIPVKDNESVDLQNRRDLLPAFIDNGFVGRNNQVINRKKWKYEHPVFRSYREAYCLLDGSIAIQDVISCDGITANQKGMLAVVSPQKAR